MGIDYGGVGGIGVEFTQDMANKAIAIGIFTREEWEGDKRDCLDRIGVTYCAAGNEYAGEITFYLFVNGITLKDINDNAAKFVEEVSKFQTGLSVDDLEVIEDIHIWQNPK